MANSEWRIANLRPCEFSSSLIRCSPFATHHSPLSMLILAIDTALDACAAGVLDTDAGELIAQESQAMKRGHAEALMPLIARVIKAAGVAFAALDRIAVTTGPGSFTGLRVGLSAARGIALAADKPVVGLTTLTAYAAPLSARTARNRSSPPIDARHDQVYFQVVSGDGSSLIRPRVAPIEEALERVAVRRAASGRQRRQNSRRPLAGRCAAAVQGRSAARAGYRLGGVARRRGQSGYRAGPALLPARARCQAAKGPAAESRAALRTHDGVAHRTGGAAMRRWSKPATLRDAPRLAQLHGASFHRGWGEGEFESMLTERNTLVHRLRLGRKVDRLCGVAHGGGRGRNIVDRGRRRPSRPRPVAQSAADASWPSCRAAACVPCSSRSRKIISRRGGCMNGPDLASPAGANAITGSRAGNN